MNCCTKKKTILPYKVLIKTSYKLCKWKAKHYQNY